jgi:hypothetical protein
MAPMAGRIDRAKVNEAVRWLVELGLKVKK